VLEVIETVKRVSGVDFKVGFAGRRVGDPNFDDLRTIVWYALAWERNLSTRRPLRSPNSGGVGCTASSWRQSKSLRPFPLTASRSADAGVASHRA
jgi:hypothetical protein